MRCASWEDGMKNFKREKVKNDFDGKSEERKVKL